MYRKCCPTVWLFAVTAHTQICRECLPPQVQLWITRQCLDFSYLHKCDDLKRCLQSEGKRCRFSYRIFSEGGTFSELQVSPHFTPKKICTTNPSFVFKPCTSHVNNTCHCKSVLLHVGIKINSAHLTVMWRVTFTNLPPLNLVLQLWYRNCQNAVGETFAGSGKSQGAPPSVWNPELALCMTIVNGENVYFCQN